MAAPPYAQTDNVRGRLARYHCPDVAHCDAHIAALLGRIDAVLPPMRPLIRDEIDLLLDRRLMMAALVEAS